ncbi:PhoH family protein [Marinicellulosiphila megalodicopiae]|uniref:PhoH family protein n=1 Tax=Marinicellulosiphila megalodicopiae TaxID=2724896 RepID=UPI003BAED1A7
MSKQSNKSLKTEQRKNLTFNLTPNHPRRLASLCGLANTHLIQIEERLDIKILNRGNGFEIVGDFTTAKIAKKILERLYVESEQSEITPDMVHINLQASSIEATPVNTHEEDHLYTLRTPRMQVKPRGPNQQKYVHQVLTNDINFGVGPAGTGKTYLAVAAAVQSLQKEEVQKILLVRPAVEAGEKLGFLPGDLSQKVDPYLRPLYDALYEMLGFEKVDRLLEKNIIEIAPLAFMRGRTLSNAYIILDESQNCTEEQMKMFLTRIGFGSTAVITGDPSQIDLQRGQRSGLRHAIDVLDNVEGISFTFFDSKDVVRHPLVQRIVDAYDKSEKQLKFKEQAEKSHNE